MSDLSAALIAAAAWIAAGVLASVDAIPGFDFVWQCGTAGAFIGGALAYRLEQRYGVRRYRQLTLRWTFAGLAGGLLYQVFTGLT